MSDGQAAAERRARESLLKKEPSNEAILKDANEQWGKNKSRLDNLLSNNSNEDLILLYDAMMGKRGIDQTRIARVGLKWLATVLRKNHDYGGSVWKKPRLAPHLDTGDSILVRLGDKIERLESLIAKEKNEVVDESLNDTFKDLCGYILLYLARPE